MFIITQQILLLRMLVKHDPSICNDKAVYTTHYWGVKMTGPGCFVITTGYMLFTNNVNVIMYYFGYLFSNHIKLDEVCGFVMYLGYVSLLLNTMVFFISPINSHCPRPRKSVFF